MGASNFSMDLGALAKPATTLVEKISDAIGGIFKPYQIKRIAQAEAEADTIRAVAQIEITDLQRRAMARLFVEEAKRQRNIESITQKALPEVTEQARPDLVEDDWITHFFDKCRLISDKDMQSLWARVLAGQANSPGAYSKRTVEILSFLERSDAVLFANLCSFVFDIGGMVPLIYNTQDSIYTDHGIGFMTLSHLDSLGLVHFAPPAVTVRKGLDQKLSVYYFGTEFSLRPPKSEDNRLNLGYVRLTKAGLELGPICGAQPREGFVDYVREQWRSLGYQTEPDAVQSAAANGAPSAPALSP